MTCSEVTIPPLPVCNIHLYINSTSVHTELCIIAAVPADPPVVARTHTKHLHLHLHLHLHRAYRTVQRVIQSIAWQAVRYLRTSKIYLENTVKQDLKLLFFFVLITRRIRTQIIFNDQPEIGGVCFLFSMVSNLHLCIFYQLRYNLNREEQPYNLKHQEKSGTEGLNVYRCLQ